MPLFDLVCNKCEVTLFDQLTRSMQTKECPACGEQMAKLVSKTNFDLKGGGWAKDGYQ